MTKYEFDLWQQKPYDKPQFTKKLKSGYDFIFTAGHGYLVVPQTDPKATLAKAICKYGFEGKLAYYLEEDSEAGRFEKHL